MIKPVKIKETPKETTIPKKQPKIIAEKKTK
jgi:hypothetical protein